MKAHFTHTFSGNVHFVTSSWLKYQPLHPLLNLKMGVSLLVLFDIWNLCCAFSDTSSGRCWRTIQDSKER